MLNHFTIRLISIILRFCIIPHIIICYICFRHINSSMNFSTKGFNIVNSFINNSTFYNITIL